MKRTFKNWWKKSSAPGWTKLNSIVTVLVGIAAFILSIRIGNQAVEIDGMKTLLGNQLKQDSELTSLIQSNTAALQELKGQNQKLIDIQNQLITQSEKQGIQVEILQKQLEIQSSQEIQLNKASKEKETLDSINFENATMALTSEISPFNFASDDSVKQEKYLNVIQNIVEQQSTNSIVLLNDSLNIRYSILREELSLWFRFFKKGDYTTMSFSTDTGIVRNSLVLWRKQREHDFKEIVNQVYDLFFYTMYFKKHNLKEYYQFPKVRVFK